MRVLYVVSALRDGGVESFLTNLCENNKKSLDKNKITAVISLENKGKYGEQIKNLGINVYELNLKFNLSFFKSFYKFIKIIKIESPDIIHSWMYHANLLSSLASLVIRKPVLWSIHNCYLPLNDYKWTTILPYFLCIITSRIFPKKILFCSKKSMKQHFALFFPKKKSIFIANGYDFKKISEEKSCNLFFNKDNNFIFGMAARWHPAKDHKNLFYAINILKQKRDDFLVLLAGKGIDADNEDLKKLAVSLGILDKLVLLGPVKNIYEFYRSLNCHLLSSATEAFPNVIVESMACSVPNISTDVGDSKYILGNTGWLVPERNPLRFSEAMHKVMVLGKPFLKDLGDKSKKQVLNRYEIGLISKKYSKVYNNII